MQTPNGQLVLSTTRKGLRAPQLDHHHALAHCSQWTPRNCERRSAIQTIRPGDTSTTNIVRDALADVATQCESPLHQDAGHRMRLLSFAIIRP